MRRARSTHCADCAPRHPDARMLAGSTDVGLWVTKQLRELRRHRSTSARSTNCKRDRRRTTAARDRRRRHARRRLRAQSAAHYPELAEMWQRFASLPIRNAGTLGGNVANGSPIGDSMPGLIALGASVVLRRGAATRALPLEDFYLGYQKKRHAPGEFVRRRVPLPTRARCSSAPTRCRSASTRTSRPCARRSRSTLDGRASSRLRASPSAAWPRRRSAPRTPKPCCVGQPWNEATAQRRMAALAQRFRAAHRHARQRRLPAAGRAEPAAPLLARDPPNAPLARARPMRRAALPAPAAASATPTAMNTRDRPAWLRTPDARCAAADWRARVGMSRCRTNRRTCTSAARAPTPTTCPSSPARCTRRSVCRRTRTHDRRASTSTRVRGAPGVVAVLHAADIPGENDCGPVIHDDPILADGWCSTSASRCSWWSPTTHDTARRAARAGQAGADDRALPAILTPARRTPRSSFVLPPMHLARGDARAAHRRRAASPRAARSRSAARSSSISKARSRTRCRGRRRHARPLLDPASERDAASGRACARPARRTTCWSNAGAWAAASAARNRSRRCSPAAPRSPRRSCCARSSCAPTATTT